MASRPLFLGILLALCDLTSAFISHTRVSGRIRDAVHTGVARKPVPHAFVGLQAQAVAREPEAAHNQHTQQLEMDVVVLGAGPVGLACCAGLVTHSTTRKVTVIEKGPKDVEKDGPFSNVIGLGSRAQKNLNEISSEIMQNIRSEALDFAGSTVMADRGIIRKGLFHALQNTLDTTDQSEILFETSATSIDTEQRRVVLDNGREVSYDLLVVADGIHSPTANKLNIPALAARKYAHYDAFKIINLPPLPAPHNEPLRMHSFSTRHRRQPDWTDVYQRKVFFSLFPRKDGTYAAILRFPLHDGKNPRGITTSEELKDLVLQMRPSNETLADVYAQYLSSVLTEETMEACLDMEPRAFWSTKRKSIVDADKGIALIGDAAIGFPSALGQGTARGFEDVTHLVECLKRAETLAGGGEGARETIARGLTLYELEVKRERKAMHDVTILAMQANDTPWLRMPKSAMTPIMDADTAYSSVKQDWGTRAWIWLARLTYATRRMAAPAAAALRASYKKQT